MTAAFRDFTREEMRAAKALPWKVLYALPLVDLGFIHYGHLAWCSRCDADADWCPCDVDEVSPGGHACNCPAGWGGRLTALIRERSGDRFGWAPAPSAEDVERVAVLLRGGA